MGSIETRGDLFAHELRGLYYVETELIDVLDELALETGDGDVAASLADHRDETRVHVDRLQTVFDAVGERPDAERRMALDGIVDDRNAVVSETDDVHLIDAYTLGAGVAIERLEITGYESLLRAADDLGFGEEITNPLEETLSEERVARKELSGHAEQSRFGRIVAALGR
jgi:ferritin-like metal-binding protein YciE